MKKSIFLTLGLVILISCSYGQKVSDKEKEKIIKEVQTKSNKLYSTEGPSTFLSSFYEASDLLWSGGPVGCIMNLKMVNSYQDKVNWINGIIKTRTSTNVTILENHFAVISKDQVIEVHKGDYTVTGLDGKEGPPLTMVNTIIWMKQDGEWKIFLMHESWAAKK